MKYFRPVACLISVLNTCFLIDWIIVMQSSVTDNPLLLALLGANQIPIVWWFKSRDRAKEMEARKGGFR